MKSILITAALVVLSGTLHAQTPKPAAGQTPAVKKAAPAPKAKPKAEAKHAPAQPEAAEAELGAAELAIAERVYVGLVPCELGNTVTLTPDPKLPGHFDMQIHKIKYRLVPVLTSTGAIRLEDTKAGAVWLQLANKSMLMNHKLGQRMADECMSPQQVVVAEQLKVNPARSLLEAPLPGAAAGLGAAPVTSPVIQAVPALPSTAASEAK